jgi:catechol 2,3-dioxygenase-like lactoylglutathione lyase family enzyme
MNKEINLMHIALHFSDKEKAELFFTKILDMTYQKDFIIDKELSDEIFGIKEKVEIVVYGNDFFQFEVFISKSLKETGFNHVCIAVDSKIEFINRCEKYDIKPLIVKKGEKKLLFIRDYSGNLYEIKEKQ